jgi:hypothetical protein
LGMAWRKSVAGGSRRQEHPLGCLQVTGRWSVNINCSQSSDAINSIKDSRAAVNEQIAFAGARGKLRKKRQESPSGPSVNPSGLVYDSNIALHGLSDLLPRWQQANRTGSINHKGKARLREKGGCNSIKAFLFTRGSTRWYYASQGMRQGQQQNNRPQGLSQPISHGGRTCRKTKVQLRAKINPCLRTCRGKGTPSARVWGSSRTCDSW